MTLVYKYRKLYFKGVLFISRNFQIHRKIKYVKSLFKVVRADFKMY